MTFSDVPYSVRKIVLPSTSDQSAMPFELRAGSLVSGELKVRQVEGRERLSHCYRFDIDVASNIDPLTVRESVLGQPAALILRSAWGTSRFVRGITAALRERGPLRHHHRHFQLRLVPTIWLLRRRRNSRIFQDLSVPDIVSALLKEGRIPHRWGTERQYSPRNYCVQYRETDYDFVMRLLREEGIFYFFESPPDGDSAGGGGAANNGGDSGDGAVVRETIVFADVPHGYPAIASPPASDGAGTNAVGGTGQNGGPPAGGDGASADSPKLYYRPTDGVIFNDDATIMTFELERVVRSKKVTLRDYDFERPLLDLTAAASAPMPGSAGADYDTAALLDPSRFEIYDHYADHAPSSVQPRSALARLEGYRGNAFVGSGSSACQRLAIGCRFTLDDHPDPRFNREFAVTDIAHVGHVPANLIDDDRAAPILDRGVYVNRFKCVESTSASRPKPGRPRTQQIVEVATVVGASGEEIHTDQYGRIKVQFPWDRQGKRNERSSCWMRVTQTWAGAGWGAQFVPRIGMEVLVTFLAGDVDRPLVVGCLANALHPTPFELPKDKSRSGWRTQSTPGGDGFNEISFEDKAGAEQLFLHAQRDLDEVVKRNHTTDIGHDEVMVVARNQSDSVGGNRDRVTAGNEDVVVAKNQAIKIKGNRTDTVDGNEDVVVGKDQSIEIKGSRTDTVDGDVDVEITGDLSTHVAGSERREVTAGTQAFYRDDRTDSVRGSFTTLVGQPLAKRAYVVHVEGAAQFAGTTAVDVSSDTAVTLRCGPSVLRLTPTGIELNAPAVRLIADGASASLAKTLDLVTSGESTLKADTILLLTDNSSVALNQNATIDGSQVFLKSPPPSADFPSATPIPPTCVELVDQNGKPVPNQRYIATYDDGSVLGGITDKDGKATLLLDQPGTIAFPDLSQTKKA